MSTVPHGEPCQAGPVRYELLRSSRRTAALEITSDGRVLVRAPRRTSRAWLDSFVLGHAGWIETHLERQRRRQEARPEPTEAQREALICGPGRSSPPAPPTLPPSWASPPPP